MPCEIHKFKFVRQFDAPIEPELNQKGRLSTITEEYKCEVCGKTDFSIKR